MILEAYEDFKKIFLQNNKTIKTTDIVVPTSKNERLTVNNRVKEIVQKDNYTEEDIELMRKYTGFGGLGMGDKDEYFTPKALAKSMVDIVDLKDGQTLLDPCTGGGIFPLVAKEKANLNIVAIEPNPLSAKVSSAILGTSVEQGYFEDFSRNEKVDAVITNVPFGFRSKELRDKDKKLKSINRLEDYIIFKSLGYLKDKGMGVFITNSRLMNGKSNVLDGILLQGEILGAVRLPNSIFADSGADVVTDIVVIKKHDSIVNEIGKDKRRELLIKPFDIANYFNDNPSHIIGKYTSKEEAIAKAIANGDKVHHMAQKDTVVSSLTHDEVFKKANEIMKTFKPTINYDAMVINHDNVKSEETIMFESEQTRVFSEMQEIGEYFRIGEPDFKRVKKFIKDYNRFGDGKYMQYVGRLLQAEKLYNLGVTDGKIVSKLIGSYYESQESQSDVNPNLITEEEFNKYKDIIVTIAETKPSWSTDGFVFENVLSAYRKFNSKDESVQVEEIDKRASISDYTENEITKNTIIQYNGDVLTLKDAVTTFDGMTKLEILKKINKDVVSDKKMDEYLNKINEFINDNTRHISSKTITIDLALAHEVLAHREKRAFIELVSTLKSLETRYRKNVIENVKENGYLDGEELKDIEPISQIKDMLQLGSTSSIISDFVREILIEDKEPRFKQVYSLPSKTKEALAMVARTEFYNIQDIITSILRNFILENEKAKKQLEDYAKSKSIFVSNTSYSEDALSEVSDLVSSEWLSNAHHYQNSDARKFSEVEDGVIRYDTGLGKSLEAMLIGAKLIKKGKKVAYIVPNEIIGKMEAEVKKVFSSKMINQTLIVTSDDKKSILEAVSNNKYRFLLMTSSVLTTQFQLGNEVTVDLFGHDQKHLNAGEENKYNISMRDYISRMPNWDSKSSYYFEDLNLDTMIIDESHRFKNAVASASSGVKGLTTTPSNVALIMLYFSVYTKYVKRNDGKGVILSTATPITSSPTEMLTTLLFSTNAKDMKSMGISSSSKFERTFFKIVKKDIIKTDGTLRNGKVLEGIKNLDILRNLGYRKVVKRTAEEESLVAKEKGKSINVKPSSTEIRIDIDDVRGKNETFGATLNDEFKRASLMLSKIEERGVTTDSVHTIAVLREFGSMFSYLDKYKKSSVSIPTALGYTQINLNKEVTEEDVLDAIGDIKVKYKIAEAVEFFMQIDVRYKVGTVAIKDYDQTEFMQEKINMFDKYCLPLLEDNKVVINIPSIEYDVVKKVMNALKKKKIDAYFEKGKYNKLNALAEKVLEMFVEYPSSKQIVYATTLSTHIIIEELIKSSTKEKIKFFHFNGSTVKNAEKKMKMQEDFNSYKGKAVLIFGSSGKVGVDFNKNVSSVHLLDVGLTPEDKEQAKGRAVRQGNAFNNVSVFNYYQNNTLDSFLEGIVGNKQEWIDNVEDADISSSSFNSDTLETIAKMAEKKYKGESGTVEQKIKRYLAFMEDEKKRKAEILEKTFTDQSVATIITLEQEAKELKTGFGNSLDDAKRMARYKIVKYLGASSLIDSREENLPKRMMDEYINNTSEWLAYGSRIDDENNTARKATVKDVIEAIETNLMPNRIRVMKDPASAMRGTLKDPIKFAKAYGEEEYENIFFKLVTKVYNETIEKIEIKAESLINIEKSMPSKIKDIKRRLNINDNLDDVIVAKLKHYDGEYLHGEKGKLSLFGLIVGKWSSTTHVGEAYLDFFKVHDAEVEVSGRGVVIDDYSRYKGERLSLKDLSYEEVATRMTERINFSANNDVNNIKNSLLDALEKVTNEQDS